MFVLIPLLTLVAVAELVARCCVSETTVANRFEQIEQIIVFLGNEPGEGLFEPDPRCFRRQRWDGLADKDHAQLAGSAASSWLDHSRAWRCLLSVRRQAIQRQAVENESRWAEQATGNYFTPNTNWTPRVSLPDFADNRHAMIDVCRQNGCEVALVVWPDQRQLLDQPTWRVPYQEAMRQVAQEADVPCVDLVPLFEQAGRWAVERFLPQDVIHVDRAGNQLVSNAVAPHVRRALRTSPTDRD